MDYYDDGLGSYTLPALAYIQTIRTSSGNVRVQIAPTNYADVMLDNTAAFTLQNDGVWELADYNNYGKLDLI
jgi:hypothetical protein